MTESCPLCGGTGIRLGWLGRYFWHRCRDCAMTFSTTPTP